MEIDSIYLLDAAQVKERVTYLLSREADGRFPWTKEINLTDACEKYILMSESAIWRIEFKKI